MVDREELEELYGKVWSTDELPKDFKVINFMAPFVTVVNRKTKKRGTLRFQDRPRFYFDFKENE